MSNFVECFQKKDGEIIHPKTRKIYNVRLFVQSISYYDKKEGYRLNLMFPLLTSISNCLISRSFPNVPIYPLQYGKIPVMVINFPLLNKELYIDYPPGLEFCNGRSINNSRKYAILQVYQRDITQEQIKLHNLYIYGIQIDYFPYVIRDGKRSFNCRRYSSDLPKYVNYNSDISVKLDAYAEEFKTFVDGVGDYIYNNQNKVNHGYSQNFFAKLQNK